MDNIDAPQWADFVAPSPQVPLDDFFLRKHEAHEYRNKLDFSEPDYSPNTNSSRFDESGTNKTVVEKTPKKTPSRKSKVKEVTHEKVLVEAMTNLQLSVMKMNKSLNKSCLMDSPVTFKTPNRVTRSMCAQAITPKCDLDESHYLSFEQDKLDDEHDHSHEDKENVDNNVHTGEVKNFKIEDYIYEKEEEKIEHEHENEQTSQIKLEVTDTSIEHDDKLEPKSSPISNDSQPDNVIQDSQDKDLPMSKIVTSFGLSSASRNSDSKKKVTALTGNAWHRQVKRRMSITNQRRQSINKILTNNKYVSMAEAITKYQRTTPQRFHTINVKSNRADLLKRQSLKLTRAMSPTLMCKKRSRPVTVLSTEEKEQLEVEKLRQNQIKANPVRKDILKKPAPLKKVEKKMVTYPEPFHLTQTKKDLPRQTKLNQTQEFKRICRVPTKTVPTIISTNEKSVVIKEEEVLHFGIPLDPVSMKKKTTKMVPFSFEARNRELQAKKQEKMKMLKESEEQKNKAEFHARPIPAAVKTPCNNLMVPKAVSANKPKKITIARSLSFDERNKQTQKKKEEKIKQMIEEEKKMRFFKAQKVPEFKPVLVKGRSKDNLFKKLGDSSTNKSNNISGNKKESNLLKSNENLATKKANNIPIMKKPFVNLMKNLIKKPILSVTSKKINSLSIVMENKENKQVDPRVPKILEPKCKISQKSIAVLTELNTDKRAKQRKEFEEQMRKKEIEDVELKKKEEQEKLEREKIENMELRKKMEIKARPMPVYKQLNISKSKKPLTEAQSPHWTKPKTNSTLH